MGSLSDDVLKEKAPAGEGRGLTDRRRGVGGCGDCLRSEFTLMAARCRYLLIQSPRVTTLLELHDRVISDRKSLFFGQSFLQAAYDLTGAPQCESNRISKHFASCHCL
jgi:hypothetical protein